MDYQLIIEILKEIRKDNKEISKDISKIQITQAEQAIILEEHQKASLHNGYRLDKIEDEIIPEIVEKLQPKPILTKKNISWFVGILVSIGGLILGILKYLSVI